jgi:hypothetical protein
VPNIKDGVYYIISALSANLALDVKGASDKSGANVQIYTRNTSDAQKFGVTNYSDRVQIACALSGRCLDLANNNFTNGANVRQWEDNNSHAQRWDIVPDGKTVTIGGKPYDTYLIKSHGTNYVCDVDHLNTKPGTNVMIHAANGGDNQRWAFVKLDTFQILSAGCTYKIVSAVDEDMVLDVKGESTANGANVMIHPDHDGPNERFVVQLHDDQTYKIIDAQSMIKGSKVLKCLDDKNGGTVKGSNVQIYQDNGTPAQSFLITPFGSMVVDGQNVQTFQVESQCGQNLYLDLQDGKGQRGQNVRLWPHNTSKAQQWAFVPSSCIDTTLPTPASLTPQTAAINNKNSFALTFICNYREFQARCRYRIVSESAKGTGAWSSWKCPLDGLGGNQGWGDAWAPTLKLSIENGDQKSTDIPMPEGYVIDGSTVTAVEVCVQIRAYKGYENIQTHGNSASKNLTFYFKPTVRVTAAKLHGTGLRIYYESDLLDGGCAVTVSAMGQTITESGKYGGSGYVLIPYDKLAHVPTGEIDVTATVTKGISSDVASAKIAVTDEPKRDTREIAITESSYGTYFVTVPTVSTDDDVTLNVTCGEMVAATAIKLKTETTRVYESVPPLHKKACVILWAVKTDGTWIAVEKELVGIFDHSYVWTFDGGACVLDLSNSKPGATQEDSISRDVQDYKIISRDYHAYRFSKTKERDLSVTGAIADDLPEKGSWNDFDALLAAGHATFRNARGEILPVAVTAISRPDSHKGWSEVKVTQKEESR